MSAEQTPDIEPVIGQHRQSDDRDDNGLPMCGCGHSLGWHETWPAHVAGVLAPVLAAAVRDAEQRAWDEAAELADTQIVLWSGVAGLHPEAQEPHPAAIAASGARRTLVVLRSRMTEAFRDRADRVAVDAPEGGEGQ